MIYATVNVLLPEAASGKVLTLSWCHVCTLPGQQHSVGRATGHRSWTVTFLLQGSTPWWCKTWPLWQLPEAGTTLPAFRDSRPRVSSRALFASGLRVRGLRPGRGVRYIGVDRQHGKCCDAIDIVVLLAYAPVAYSDSISTSLTMQSRKNKNALLL